MENTLCIVLRSVDYKDCDKMLTLFSRKHGRLTALAAGAKNLKNPIAAACQPFCCGIYSFMQKKDKLYVSQCEIKKEYYSLGGDYEKFASACVMIEMAEKILSNSAEYDRLFVLLVNCLSHLESTVPSKQVLAYFYIQLTDIMGICPSTEFCVICGSKVPDPKRFCIPEGGVICSNCASGLKTVSIDGGMMHTFDEMLRTNPKKFCRSDTFPDTLTELMQRYLDENGDIKSRAAKLL